MPKRNPRHVHQTDWMEVQNPWDASIGHSVRAKWATELYWMLSRLYSANAVQYMRDLDHDLDNLCEEVCDLLEQVEADDYRQID